MQLKKLARFLSFGGTGAILLIVITCWLPSSSYGSMASFLPGVELGQNMSQADQALEKGRGQTGWTWHELKRDDPGRLSQVMVDMGLLAMLNAAKATHTLLKEGGEHQVAFVVVEHDKFTYLLGFAGEFLEIMLVSAQVVPDNGVGGERNPFHKGRLRPIQSVLEKMRATGCRVRGVDGSGPNHFEYRGNCGLQLVYAQYQPEKDMFFILYHR
jgi:hypothetical protein